MARMPKLRGQGYNDWVRVQGEETIIKGLEAGRGLVCFSGHLGNWEYAGAWGANRGYAINFVVAKQANPGIEDLIDQYRKSSGINIIKKQDAAKDVIRALRRNELVAIMIDQDAGRHGVHVDFFGRPASTPRGAALFAIKMKAPLVFMRTRRGKDGRIYTQFIEVEKPDTGDRDRDVYELTQTMTTMLEESIREVPEQWLWLHRRFKTKPEGLKHKRK